MTREESRYQADRFEVVRVTPDAASGLPPKDIIRHPGAVVIIPRLDATRLCLIDNFRLSVNRTLIELPAGTCQPGESHAETARRELEEETGYQAQRWTYLGELLMSPGILDERMYVYAAEELERGQPQLEQDERIQTREATWHEVWRWIEQGELQDAKTIAALTLWRLKSEPSA